MKKIKKSTGVTLALLVYVSVTAAYLLPRNVTTSDLEKYITLGASYLIVLVLWFVLKKKEKMQQQRREDEQSDRMNQKK